MVAPAVLAGVSLLGLGLLVALSLGRRAGPWLATPAVVLVGACFPWLHTSRSTYSEPLAAVTLSGGFLALALATAAGEGRGPRLAARTALVAGILVGGTSIVRIDALRETMLLVPVAALLLARGRAWGRQLLAGSIGATLLGFAVAGAMSTPPATASVAAPSRATLRLVAITGACRRGARAQRSGSRRDHRGAGQAHPDPRGAG